MFYQSYSGLGRVVLKNGLCFHGEVFASTHTQNVPACCTLSVVFTVCSGATFWQRQEMCGLNPDENKRQPSLQFFESQFCVSGP